MPAAGSAWCSVKVVKESSGQSSLVLFTIVCAKRKGLSVCLIWERSLVPSLASSIQSSQVEGNGNDYSLMRSSLGDAATLSVSFLAVPD